MILDPGGPVGFSGVTNSIHTESMDGVGAIIAIRASKRRLTGKSGPN